MSRGLSLRTRLALRFAAVVAALALLYAAGVYAFARATLGAQLRERLHEDFELAEHGFVWFPTFSWSMTQPPPDERSPEAPWAEIRGPDGLVMLQRPGPDVPRPQDSEVYERDHLSQGVLLHVRVGRSWAPTGRTLRDLLLLLAACWVPLVALSFLAGRWFAGRALAPVAAMTERARAISAERLSERLPVSHDDELGRLASVFNEAFARLERSFEALRRFTADASHELRTPLTTLRSVGEVALRERLGVEGQREAIGSMLEEGERLSRLVEDLLTLARADARRVAPDLGPASLADLAREAARTLGVLAEERGQRLELVEVAPSPVRADPRLLQRAVTNLVHNALRYSPEGATVTVRSGARGHEAILEVVDQGPGIAPEHHAQVFERFFRVDPSRGGGGSGLGLSIARWAAEAHGGRIELESAPGRGSTFRLVLPRGEG